jgi:hypothetical protein
MGLRMLSEQSEATTEILRSITREEFLDPANRALMDDLKWLARESSFRLYSVPRDPEKRWEQFRRLCIP